MVKIMASNMFRVSDRVMVRNRLSIRVYNISIKWCRVANEAIM